jgi:hypothetical protein
MVIEVALDKVVVMWWSLVVLVNEVTTFIDSLWH